MASMEPGLVPLPCKLVEHAREHSFDKLIIARAFPRKRRHGGIPSPRLELCIGNCKHGVSCV